MAMLGIQVSVAPHGYIALAVYGYYAVEHVYGRHYLGQDGIANGRLSVNAFKQSLVATVAQERAHAVTSQRQGDGVAILQQLHHMWQQFGIGHLYCVDVLV
jgi:hypothetical protein